MQTVRSIGEVPEFVVNMYIGLQGIYLRLFHTVIPEARNEEWFSKYLFPSCHITARAIARRMPGLECRDGYVLTFRDAGKSHTDILPDENCGVLIRETPHGAEMQTVATVAKWHSWLAFAEYPGFIIDIVPLGAIQTLSGPMLAYLDKYALPYQEESLPEEFLNSITEKEIETYLKLLDRACVSISASRV